VRAIRAADLYRALLWCYPAQFRHEYGGEMLHAFRQQLSEANRSASPFAATAIWARTVIELVPTAIREHLHVIRQDLRYAVRILAANPAFTAVVVLSLALGIGANTAVFSLLDDVLFSTLPVRNARELVILSNPDASGVSAGTETGDRSLLTYPEFRQLQAQTSTFASVMASESALSRLEARVAGGAPEEIAVRLVSANYFQTLGVTASLGRTFDPRPEPAPGAAPYGVISHEFWTRRFGGRADVLGRVITLRGGSVSVIGVAPPSFFGETVGERPDVWIPLAMQALVLPGRDWLHDQAGTFEKVMWLHVFGRMSSGRSVAQAQADVDVVFGRTLAASYESLADPEQRKQFMNQRLSLKNAATGASSIRSDFSEPLMVLLGATALVLLIACSNLGNLLLARTTARSREMAVRLALGASRGRVLRQLVTESLCLAAMGGVVGLGAALALRATLIYLVSNETIALPGGFDLRTLGFIVGLTLVTGLVLGVLPGLRVTNADSSSLRDEGRGVAGSAGWLRLGKFVVIGQLALTLPLLVGAGLLARTLFNLQHVDVGYAKDGMLTVRVDARPANYHSAREMAAFEAMSAAIRALPGVRAATYSNNGLFGGTDNGDSIAVEGYTPRGDNDAGSRYDQVGPRYFSTIGIPVLLGREITEDDRAGGRQVCVINETFAKRFFAGRTPLGLHVTQRYAEQHHTYEVVGVVGDSRQNRLRGEIEHRFYTPLTQPAASVDTVTFIIRPRGAASSVLVDIKRAVQRIEPDMPVVRAASVSEAIDRRIVQDRLLARLSLAFGVIAVLLAALGLYGVLSYAVARRTNEIGVRKALGARDGVLIAMIVRETGWLLLAGSIAGCALAAAAIRLITSRLYGVSPNDPTAFAGAVTGLAIVALVATWLPAYRASRVDPLVALRHE
jgi:putative ABC transport system permease protein